jgi:flagellar protein FliJ
MKPFRFPLEAVQKIRERGEHQAMEVYARAWREQKAVLDGAQQARQKLRAHERSWREQAAAGCSAADMAHGNSYCFHLRALCCDWERQVNAAAENTKAALSEMLAARRKRELVDKLRERQLAAHQVEEGRQELKWLDELAVRKHTRTTASQPMDAQLV